MPEECTSKMPEQWMSKPYEKQGMSEKLSQLRDYGDMTKCNVVSWISSYREKKQKLKKHKL